PIDEVTLTSGDGHTIHLRGKIGRVDMYGTKDGAYVNLIDYKSRARSISKASILNGHELQMMTYMHVLVEKGPEYFGKERMMPNSVVCFRVSDPLSSLDGEKSLEHAEQEQKERMRPDGRFINVNADYDGMIDETSACITG